MIEVAKTTDSLNGRRCPSCQYDLIDLANQVCPECGGQLDPATSTNARRRLWWQTGILTFIVLYAPYSWLLFVSDDLSYVRYWIIRWPVLPGLSPTFLILAPFNYSPAHLPAGVSLSIMGAFTLIAIALISSVASRSQRSLIVTMIIAAALSLLNGWMAQAIFAA